MFEVLTLLVLSDKNSRNYEWRFVNDISRKVPRAIL